MRETYKQPELFLQPITVYVNFYTMLAKVTANMQHQFANNNNSNVRLAN